MCMDEDETYFMDGLMGDALRGRIAQKMRKLEVIRSSMGSMD